jgi:hypothetical protein
MKIANSACRENKGKGAYAYKAGFKFNRTALAFALALATTPALAGQSWHASPSTSSHALLNDRASKACIHNGLPCSTISAPWAAKTDTPLRQLDLIERQSLNAFRGDSQHQSTFGYRPALIQPAKQPATEFAYHLPRKR